MSRENKMSSKEASKLFTNQSGGSHKQNLPEKTRIRTLSDLNQLISRLKPGAEESAAPIVINTLKAGIADETYKGDVTIPQSNGQSTIRQTLLDGFKIVKNQMEYYNASLSCQEFLEDFGGYPPVLTPNPEQHMTWLDAFIDRNMGGKREGLYIVWDLPEGKFRLDPWSCTLEKINVS